MPCEEILLLHHTHTDVGYTHPQFVVWELLRRYLDQAIELCEATADWPEDCRLRWTCEVTAPVVRWLATASQRQIDRLRALVRAGQISFGAMYLHWNVTVREDTLAESLLPVGLLRDTLAAPVSVAMAHDVNGLPWSTVEMLLDAGVAGLITGINIHYGGYPLTRPLAFHWQGKSGRSLPVFSGEHYNSFSRVAGLQHGDVNRMASGIQRHLERLYAHGYDLPFVFQTVTHPFADDNNPPFAGLAGLIRRWNQEGRAPPIRLVTPEMLWQRLASLPEGVLSNHAGDWTDYWTCGCGSAALELLALRKAHDALWDARLLATTDPVKRRWNREVESRAVEQICLGEEHTYGAFCSTGTLQSAGPFAPLPVAEQWYQTASAMYGALTCARWLRREALSGLGVGLHPEPGDAQGLLVFNPSSSDRRVCLRLPTELARHNGTWLTADVHRLDVTEEMIEDEHARWLGPVDVPAYGLVTVSTASARACPSAAAPHEPAAIRLRSPRYEMTLDELTCRVVSLIDLDLGVELIDREAEFGLFEMVHETVADRVAAASTRRDPRWQIFHADLENFQLIHDDVSCWNHNWQARYQRAETTSWHTRTTPAAAVLERRFRCAGVVGEATQWIKLDLHEPRVCFEVYFHKEDNHHPEAIYFTFPFHIASAQAWYDTAGQALKFDVEQLPGACREWITADSYVAVEGDFVAATLACPDAPLFQVGGMNFGRGIRSSDDLDQALLLAWPMNNYWNTNFRVSQPGPIRLRYELTTSARFRPAASRRFADSAGHPPVVHPLPRCRPGLSRRLMVLEGSGLTLVQVKDASHGDGLVVRVRNHEAQSVAAGLSFPGRVMSAAWQSDGLERPAESLCIRNHAVTWSAPPMATSTLLVSFAGED